MEKKVGLFITRAQPGLHKGHLDGIQQGWTHNLSKMIIGIGSSNKEYNAENPFTFDERRKLVEITSKDLHTTMQTEIYAIPDFGDAEKWGNYIFQELPHFDYVITGNPQVAQIMQQAGKETINVEVREFVKGSTIREMLARRQTSQLNQYLSTEAIEYLETIGAPERLQDIFKKEMKSPRIAVDIVAFDKRGKLILIERKNYPTGVALPGGFVDVGEKLVTAATREALEELNLQLQIDEETDYLGYWDNPDRDPRGHAISHAFKANILAGKVKAGDDAKAIVEVDLDQLDSLLFAFPDHKEMILKAVEKLQKDQTE